MGHRKIGKFWFFPGPGRDLEKRSEQLSPPMRISPRLTAEQGGAASLSHLKAELRMRHTAASNTEAHRATQSLPKNQAVKGTLEKLLLTWSHL